MVCEHLRKLKKYIDENDIQISSMELVNIVCNRCKEKQNLICIGSKVKKG